MTVEKPKEPPPTVMVYRKLTVGVKCTNPQCGRVNIVEYEENLHG